MRHRKRRVHSTGQEEPSTSSPTMRAREDGDHGLRTELPHEEVGFLRQEAQGVEQGQWDADYEQRRQERAQGDPNRIPQGRQKLVTFQDDPRRGVRHEALEKHDASEHPCPDPPAHLAVAKQEIARDECEDFSPIRRSRVPERGRRESTLAHGAARCATRCQRNRIPERGRRTTWRRRPSATPEGPPRPGSPSSTSKGGTGT